MTIDTFYRVIHASSLTDELDETMRHSLNHSLARMLGCEDWLTELKGTKSRTGSYASMWLYVEGGATGWWNPTDDMGQAMRCLRKIDDEAVRDRILTYLGDMIWQRVGPGQYKKRYFIFDLEPLEICIAIAKALAIDIIELD